MIDVTEKAIEFRNFQNAKVLLEVVAGHLTMDLQPEHAAALQKQLTPQMWEQPRQGQEATILRSHLKNWFGVIIDRTSCHHDRHPAKGLFSSPN